MRAANLSSSAIKRVAYDEQLKTLSIWFADSGRYVYSEVPRSVYEALCASNSAGRCYNEMVKSRFPCRFDPARRRFRPTGERNRR